MSVARISSGRLAGRWAARFASSSWMSVPRGRSQSLVDAALAVAAFAATTGLLAHGLGNTASAPRRLDLLGVALAAAASLPLLAWRRAPMAVFVATLAASATAMSFGYPGAPPIGATIALYLLARSRDDLHPWTVRMTAVVIGLLAVHVTAFGIGRGTLPALELVFGALVWAVAWFAGDRARLRRVEISQLEQRAVRAEQEAQRERRLAAAEERARIARDLHDSAGHAINVIAVHAGAARLLHERDPAGSRAAIETIEEVARQTVGEIDQIVRSLRDGHGPGEDVEAPPGLATLSALVAQHESAGLAVTVRQTGGVRSLAGPPDQAAYRILQEALTNAARHGTGSAEVELLFGDRTLDLTVTNAANGSDGARSRGGHGLVGMYERAAMLGGRFEAGRCDGSFTVHASLPYRGR